MDHFNYSSRVFSPPRSDTTTPKFFVGKRYRKDRNSFSSSDLFWKHGRRNNIHWVRRWISSLPTIDDEVIITKWKVFSDFNGIFLYDSSIKKLDFDQRWFDPDSMLKLLHWKTNLDWVVSSWYNFFSDISSSFSHKWNIEKIKDLCSFPLEGGTKLNETVTIAIDWIEQISKLRYKN